MFNKTVALAAFLSLLTLPCISAAQHGHDDGHADLLVGGDSAGVGNLMTAPRGAVSAKLFKDKGY